MEFGKREKKRSFFWVYIVLIVAFIIWVMLDDTGEEVTEAYSVYELNLKD